MPNAEKPKRIFEFGKKLRGLQDWAVQANDISLNSEHAISRKTGIKRSTLKTNVEKEHMSSTNQEALAKAFGFQINWPEWLDLNAIRSTTIDQRRDSADAFIKKFLAFKSRAACLTIDAGLTEKHIDRRFANFSFAVGGSFEPSPQVDKIPLVLSLSFDRRGWPMLLEGVKDVLTVGLKEVDLQLFYDRSAAKIELKSITCHTAEGNFHGKVEGLAPWWIINVTAAGETWLAGRRLRNDGQDCVCQGFHAGDKIRAVMTARVNDCFVRVTGEPFEGVSKPKQRFIEHLIKLAVLNGTEAVLGEQTLTVVDKS